MPGDQDAGPGFFGYRHYPERNLIKIPQNNILPPHCRIYMALFYYINDAICLKKNHLRRSQISLMHHRDIYSIGTCGSGMRIQPHYQLL